MKINLKAKIKENAITRVTTNVISASISRKKSKSEAMKTIVLEKQDIFKGNLILVNKKFPLCQYNSETDINLVPVSAKNSEILLGTIAAKMLSQLMLACNVENQIVPISGYRTLKEQEQIFGDSMRENGEEFTLKFVALPNQSEHQTGLAIDVAENKENIDFICPSFPYEGICQKFRSKAYKYGFIERYPKGKEVLTGISHEPWHFRYVGYPHSEIIQKNDFSLEEYIDFLKDYSYDGKHLLFENMEHKIEVFYVKAEAEAQNTIFLTEDIPYKVSGNNVDGFIITLWRRS